jgi:hypothetical protein
VKKARVLSRKNKCQPIWQFEPFHTEQYCINEKLIMKVRIIEEKAYLLTVARVLGLRELANPPQSSIIKCAKII